MLFYSVAVSFFIASVLSSGAEAGLFPAAKPGIIGRYKRQYQINVIKREASRVASRVPNALFQSAVDFGKGYTTTTAMMFPVEIALNYRQIEEKGYKSVVASSFQKATEWGQRSGTYKAIETFLSEMRQSKDRWNTYFASGIASTISKRKVNKNSFQSTKSFCSGFGTAVAMDAVKYVVNEKASGIIKRSR